ncbi:hypothetical protein V9T40_007046 [Parthenolecanium corni]|uniref:Elongation of very long chain fatty acids protein n=1 Tax=Parthenolecanium corni TaxID=536013 RepID=A0AAN9TVR9_9HEMI
MEDMYFKYYLTLIQWRIQSSILVAFAAYAAAAPGSIKVRNTGGYTAVFRVEFDHGGKKESRSSGDFTLGVNKAITIPDGAKNIFVKVEEYWIGRQKTTVFTKSYSSAVTKVSRDQLHHFKLLRSRFVLFEVLRISTMNYSLPYHPFATELELSGVGRELKYVVFENQLLAYTVGLVYVVLVFSLQTWMKNRKPFKLKLFSISWNFFLFVVNTIGFCRMIVHIVFVLRIEGFHSSVCNDEINEKDAVALFWSSLFPFVKIIELGDTFLIVLQKRFLATFYWTHHLFALLVTWYIFPFFTSATEWFGLLIYFNHIPIYFLATIKSLGIKLPKKYSTGLMISEVGHMVSGIALCSAIFYLIFTHQYCDTSLLNNFVLMVAYVTCLILSAYLLYYRFLRTTKNSDMKSTNNDIPTDKNSPEMSA